MKFTKRTQLKKKFCVFLACVMLLSFIPVYSIPVSAASADAERSRIEEVREILDSIAYSEYLTVHEASPLGTGEIPVSLTNDAGISAAQHEGANAVLLPEEGTVTFSFNVPREGMYNLLLTYMQFEGKNSAIERLIRINGKVPFKEARYVIMTKIYQYNWDEYDENGNPAFIRDIRNNELRPGIIEAPEWRTVLAEDSSGFVEEPLMFYLQAGENTISFEPVREQVYISEIKFTQPSTLLSYEQYLAANSGRGTAEIPRIQAEMPAAISEIVIHPINDRTSAATEPQDASRIRLNSIGGTRWQLYGQWVKYEAVVPAGGAGLYKIVTRFKQALGISILRKMPKECLRKQDARQLCLQGEQ